MEPDQKSVVDEKAQLDERATELSEFIGNSPLFEELCPREQERMKRQNDIMWQYSEILGERIAAFSAVALPCLTMLLIDPKNAHFDWAIAEGGMVVARGKALTVEDIEEVRRREFIADVFIDEGFRTLETRKIAAEKGWHCVKGRFNRGRDGIAEMIHTACES